MAMTREQYLLICLAEECDEVGQRVMKALRFGLSEVQAGQELSNAERILDEMQDLVAVYTILSNENMIPDLGFVDVDRKLSKIEKFMSISRREGVLGEERNEE